MIRLHQWFKNQLRRSGMNDEALHIHAGLLIWLAGVLVTGSPASPWPVVVTIGVEILNEIFDRVRKGEWHWDETLPDFVRTTAWPIIFWLMCHSWMT